jgi:carboxymethylenebutenolidase
MKRYFTALMAITFALTGRASVHSAVPAYGTPDAAIIKAARYRACASRLSRAGLPTEQMAKALLSTALKDRHPQWNDIPAGPVKVRSFVVFPDRTDHAPAVVITAKNQGMSDWLRAVADDAAQQGFISIVPDLPPGMAPDPVLQYAIKMPASNGNGASVTFNFAQDHQRIDTVIESPRRQERSFELTDHSWHTALAFLGQINTFTAAAPQVPASGTRPKTDDRPNMASKTPDLPANFLMAAKTVAQSPRKGGWIDIPMAGTKLHTWISYPQTAGKAPVILVFQPGPGMDMGEPVTRGGGANWLRGIADQLASEGFIAVLPDLTSGLGPNGGNFDSFQYPDDSAAALGHLSHTELLNRVRSARDYAMKLSMANGRLGVIGFCFGGALAWESAAQIDGVNASVVFYGGPPPEEVMAKITAPVIAFFGRNDLGLEPVIAPATADMKRLGKEFEVHAYENATHAFLYRQDLGRNYAATRDAWPRAIAFFKKHLL